MLNSDKILALFKERDVAILRADWTQYNEEITAFLASHQRAGVPLYVYYDKQGKAHILPQLLSFDQLKTILQ